MAGETASLRRDHPGSHSSCLEILGGPYWALVEVLWVCFDVSRVKDGASARQPGSTGDWGEIQL
jgi:hypothetical protein